MSIRLPSPKRWPVHLLRAAVTCEVLLAFTQAIWMGGFLQGAYPLLAVHQENATVTAVAAFAMTVAAVLCWRLGHGSARPILACVTIDAAIVVQIIFGYARILAVHVPLGVAIIVGTVLLCVKVWQRPPPRTVEPATLVTQR
jgi:hypothetical protein